MASSTLFLGNQQKCIGNYGNLDSFLWKGNSDNMGLIRSLPFNIHRTFTMFNDSNELIIAYELIISRTKMSSDWFRNNNVGIRTGSQTTERERENKHIYKLFMDSISKQILINSSSRFHPYSRIHTSEIISIFDFITK